MPQADFDVLTYSRDLEATGLSRHQAETIARGTTRMLSQQLDTMVTRDHFDLHMERMDQRFKLVDQRFDHVDQRFTQVYQRFDQMDRRFDQVYLRFEQTDQSIAGLDTRIGRLERGQSAHTVLLSIITLAVVIPLLQSLAPG